MRRLIFLSLATTLSFAAMACGESGNDDTIAPFTSASPAGGTFSEAQSVTLSCNDGDGSGCIATFYTVDGSAPDQSSSVYSSPIHISSDTVLKFFSVDAANNQETARTETYVIGGQTQDTTAPITTPSPLGGSFQDAQSVTLSCADEAQGSGCANTYYTTDGTEPTTSSSIYSTPILIDASATLQFFSVDQAGNQETTKTEIYQIVGQCEPGVDTDSDGLDDCDELAGWNMELDLNGDGDTEDAGEHEVHVSSDPFSADADGDGLTDPQERSRRINPNKADTDQDDLSDFDEINVYFSNPDHVDSDGDATGPNHDQLPDSGLFDGSEVMIHHTSPQMEDTDGDSFTDYEEIQSSGNPLVADLPLLTVEIVTDVGVTLHAEVIEGCDITGEILNSSIMRNSTRSSLRSSTAFKTTFDMSDSLHSEMSTSVEGIFPKASASGTNDFSMSTSTSLESNLTFERDSARDVSQEYRDYRRQDCFSNTSAKGGSITATIRVSNVGGAPVYLSNMEVIALKRDLHNPGHLTTLASVELFQNEISLGGSPIDTSVDIPLSASEAMELLADPSGLLVYASRYSMTDENHRDYAFIESETIDRTGMVEIDFGDGRLERYMVATNVERDESNNPVGVNLAWALENTLGLERGVNFDTVTTNSGLSLLQYVDDAQQYGTDTSNNRAWMVSGDGSSFDNLPVSFEDIVLHKGEVIRLSYLRDSDGDGLFDTEEDLFGSDPNEADTDNDTVSDLDEARADATQTRGPGMVVRHPVVPEFPAGKSVKQVATAVSPWEFSDVRTMVLLDNGTVWSLDGEPIQLATDIKFDSIAGGGNSTDGFTWFGVTDAGDLYAWGSNKYGKLGIASSQPDEISTPVLVSDCACWKKVDAGDRHVLAIRNDGSLWAWGYGKYGQLGTDSIPSEFCPGTTNQNFCSRQAVQVDSGPWMDIAAGLQHSLGIKEDLTLWAWGQNHRGQLGLGDTSNRSIPTRVYDTDYASHGDDTWRMVDAWQDVSLAVLDIGANEFPSVRDDALRTWGRQTYSRYGAYNGATYKLYEFGGQPISQCQNDDQCGGGQACNLPINGIHYCQTANAFILSPRPLVDNNAPDDPILSISAGPASFATWGKVVSSGIRYHWQATYNSSWGYNVNGDTGRGPGNDGFGCMKGPVPVDCYRLEGPLNDASGSPLLVIHRGRGIGAPSQTGQTQNPPSILGELNVWGINDSGQLGMGYNSNSEYTEPVLVPEFPLP